MDVTVKFIADPFKPTRFVERQCGAGLPALDAFRATFPDFIDAPVIILRNSRRLDGDELLHAGDTIIVGVVPQAGITAAMVVKWVVAALISAAVSYLVGALTKPKSRSSNAKAASPSYSIQLDQNAARLGEIIPVVYGRVRLMPDIASQPYSEFINNNEHAHMILCLGMGEFLIHDVYVGESRVQDYPTGSITYTVMPASTTNTAHWQQLGPVEIVTGVCEDMATIAETGGIDIAAPNDPSEASVIAVASGGTLTPVDPSAVNVWGGLVAGRTYNVANSSGSGTAAVFVGLGPGNSSVWDRALPQPGGVVNINTAAIVAPYNDAAHGEMAYVSTQQLITLTVGELILIKRGTDTFGPFEVVERRPNSYAWNLNTSGPGWTSAMPGGGIYPQQAVTIQRNAVVNWTVSEYVPGVNPAEPYRWVGWYMTGRSDTLTNRVFVDVIWPNGLAWITDKGNYVNHSVVYLIDIQQVDSNGQPIGGVARYQRTVTGATTTARKVTWAFDVATARYRVRVSRATDRNQAASREISSASLFSIRFRVWHPPATPAYENCTLLIMSFVAGAGLAAASNRRVTVDCSRLVLNLERDAWVATRNPAMHVIDAYTDTEYGGARPLDEIDLNKYWYLAGQWNTTAGFNAIYDSQITLIEAMQQMLNVVRAIPTPTGRMLSVTQDAPRQQDYIFDDSNTVVDSVTIGYGFDGEDVPDCLEIVYTNPVTFTEARAYYPSQGVRPDSLELFGCTNEGQALDWAKCVWQDRKLNRKTCELELEAEGYLLGPLTRFGVAIPVLNVEAAGRVMQYDATALRVEADGPLPAGVTVVQFIGDDGKSSANVPIASIEPGRTIFTLAAAPSVPIWTADNRRDATIWRAGAGSTAHFQFQGVNIQTAGAMRVRVSGKEYNAAAYAGTFVENWVTGD